MKYFSCNFHIAWILLYILEYDIADGLLSDKVGYTATSQQEQHATAEHIEKVCSKDEYMQPKLHNLETESSTDVYPDVFHVNGCQNIEDGNEKDGNIDKETKHNEESEYIKAKPDTINVTTIYLAGYDDQIFQLMNDIQNHGQGQELLVYFYLYENLNYLNLGNFYTDKKILQDNILKYTHYFCIDNNATKSTWCLDNLGITKQTDSKAQVQIIQEINTKPRLNDDVIPYYTTLAKDIVQQSTPKLHTEKKAPQLYEFVLPKKSDIGFKNINIDLLKSKLKDSNRSLEYQTVKVGSESDANKIVKIPSSHSSLAQKSASFDPKSCQEDSVYFKNVLGDRSLANIKEPINDENYLLPRLIIPCTGQKNIYMNNDTMYSVYTTDNIDNKKYPEQHDDKNYLRIEKSEMNPVKNDSDSIEIISLIPNENQIYQKQFNDIYPKPTTNDQDPEILKNDSSLNRNINYQIQDTGLFNDKIGVPPILNGTPILNVEQNRPKNILTDINFVQFTDNKSLKDQNTITDPYLSKDIIKMIPTNNIKRLNEVNELDHNELNKINVITETNPKTDNVDNFTLIEPPISNIQNPNTLQDISTPIANVFTLGNTYLNKDEVEPKKYLNLIPPNITYKVTQPTNEVQLVQEINKTPISLPASLKLDVISEVPTNKDDSFNYFSIPNIGLQGIPQNYAQNYDTYNAQTQNNVNYKLLFKTPITKNKNYLRNITPHKLQFQRGFDKYGHKYKSKFLTRYWPYQILQANNNFTATNFPKKGVGIPEYISYYHENNIFPKSGGFITPTASEQFRADYPIIDTENLYTNYLPSPWSSKYILPKADNVKLQLESSKIDPTFNKNILFKPTTGDKGKKVNWFSAPNYLCTKYHSNEPLLRQEKVYIRPEITRSPMTQHDYLYPKEVKITTTALTPPTEKLIKKDILSTPFCTPSPSSDKQLLENPFPTSSTFQWTSKATQTSYLNPTYVFNIPSSHQRSRRPKFEQLTKGVTPPSNQINFIPIQQDKKPQASLLPTKFTPCNEELALSSSAIPLYSSFESAYSFSPMAVTPNNQKLISHTESIKPLSSYQINNPINFNPKNICPSERQYAPQSKYISYLFPLKEKTANLDSILPMSDNNGNLLPNDSNENMSITPVQSKMQESNKFASTFNGTTSYNLLSMPLQTSYTLKKFPPLVSEGTYSYEPSYSDASNAIHQLPPKVILDNLLPHTKSLIHNLPLISSSSDTSLSGLKPISNPKVFKSSINITRFPFDPPSSLVPQIDFSLKSKSVYTNNVSTTNTTPAYNTNILEPKYCFSSNRNNATLPYPIKIPNTKFDTDTIAHTVPTSYSKPLLSQASFNNILPDVKILNISPTPLDSRYNYALPAENKTSFSFSPNIYLSPKLMPTTQVPTSSLKPLLTQVRSLSYKNMPPYDLKTHLNHKLHTAQAPRNYFKPLDTQPYYISPIPLNLGNVDAVPLQNKIYSFATSVSPTQKLIQTTQVPTSLSKTVGMQPSYNYTIYVPPDGKIQNISPTLLSLGDIYDFPIRDKTSYAISPKILPTTKAIQTPQIPTSYLKSLATQSTYKYIPQDGNPVTAESKKPYFISPNTLSIAKPTYPTKVPISYSKPLDMQQAYKDIPQNWKTQNISPALLDLGELLIHPVHDKTSSFFPREIYPTEIPIHSTHKPTCYSKSLSAQPSSEYITPDLPIQNFLSTIPNSEYTFVAPDKRSYSILPNIPASKTINTTQVPTTHEYTPQDEKIRNSSPTLLSFADTYKFPEVLPETHSSLLANISPIQTTTQTTLVPINYSKPLGTRPSHKYTPQDEKIQNIAPTSLGSGDEYKLYNTIISKPLATTLISSADTSPALDLGNQKYIVSELTPYPSRFYKIMSAPPDNTVLDSKKVRETFSEFIASELQNPLPTESPCSQSNKEPKISGAVSSPMIQKPLSYLSSEFSNLPYVVTSSRSKMMEPGKEIYIKPFTPLHQTKPVSTTNYVDRQNIDFVDKLSTISPFLSNQSAMSPMSNYNILWTNLKSNHTLKLPYNSNTPIKPSVIYPLPIPAKSTEGPVTLLPLTSTRHWPYSNSFKHNLTPFASLPTPILLKPDLSSTKKLSDFSNPYTAFPEFVSNISPLSSQSATSSNSFLDIPKDSNTVTDSLASLYQSQSSADVAPSAGLNKQISSVAEKYLAYRPTSIFKYINPNPVINQINYNINKLISQPNVLNDIVSKKSVSIPLQNIGIAEYEPLKLENVFFVKTDNPDIDLKAWPATIRILRAKLVLEGDEMNTLNFIPIVKKAYTEDNVQRIVKDFITRSYGKPIVVKAVYNYNKPYAFVVNLNEDYIQNDVVYVVWPTLCKCGCNMSGCRCGFN